MVPSLRAEFAIGAMQVSLLTSSVQAGFVFGTLTSTILGLDDRVTSMSPPELMRAILQAPVDLLWNGGIGTYIKAERENNVQVGDPTNDPLRVDASELGIGEFLAGVSRVFLDQLPQHALLVSVHRRKLQPLWFAEKICLASGGEYDVSGHLCAQDCAPPLPW